MVSLGCIGGSFWVVVLPDMSSYQQLRPYYQEFVCSQSPLHGFDWSSGEPGSTTRKPPVQYSSLREKPCRCDLERGRVVVQGLGDPTTQPGKLRLEFRSPWTPINHRLPQLGWHGHPSPFAASVSGCSGLVPNRCRDAGNRTREVAGGVACPVGRRWAAAQRKAQRPVTSSPAAKLLLLCGCQSFRGAYL